MKNKSPEKARADISVKLVAAAKELIIQKGFEQVGVREIAKKAGLFPIQIYRLGFDKKTLLALISLELGEQQLIAIRDFMQRSSPKGTLLEKTKAYLRFLYELDIAAMPIRSQSVAYSWYWEERFEDEIISQIYRFLEPVERWMNEEGLDEIPERCMLIWSLYYAGFRGAVVRGGSAQECLDGIERRLAIALR